MSRRINTVHDLATLRLHPDGSRVQATERQSKYVTKDTRGNWIALDAGGAGTVKKRRRTKDLDTEEEREEIDIDQIGSNDEEQGRHSEPSTQAKTGKRRAKTKPLKDARAIKRKNFHEDLEFITHVGPPDWKAVGFPVPSSDLLKCIHYFAANFYSERGELLDVTREARREKKKRKLEREKEKQSESSSKEDEEGSQTEESSRNGSEEPNFRVTKRRKGRQGPQEKPVRDMYKIFTGSALMALGMLFQEHVGRLLQPNVAREGGSSVHESLQDNEIKNTEEDIGERGDLMESDVDDSDHDSDFIPD